MAVKSINFNSLFESVIHYEPDVYNKELALQGEKLPLYALSNETFLEYSFIPLNSA